MTFRFKVRRYVLEQAYVDVEANTEEDAHEVIGDMDEQEWDWSHASTEDWEVDDVIVK